ncbi:MAG TPA: hypothetical protein VGQ89_12545 [Candidatus Limnocylindrales bacterium]|jgi:hypothetical protein|nr:hypothetical protein [Candidatus Limnocylindrales bacterium]
MIRRLATPYAIVGLVAALVGAVGAIALRMVDPVPLLPGTFGFGVTALIGFELLGVAFASVGALLVVRRPENAVGWCMVVIGDGYALGGLTAAITSSAVADGPVGAETARIAAWLTVFFTTLGGLVFALGFIFPTGRGHTPAWDRLIRVGAVTWPFIFAFLFLFRPGALHLFATIDNPFGIGPDLRTLLGPQASQTLAASAAAFLPFLALNLASRYRMADAIGRQQLKWFVLALLVTIAGVAVAALGALVSDQPPEAGLVVFGYAGALIPVAIGIAILRYRLYDIDRLISRTIAYAIVSAITAIVFGGVILLLSAALASFAQGQTIAVAASTLAAFAVFQPVLRRARRDVDRRFNRARYDAEQTIAAFSARLRDEVDIATVTTDLHATVQEAVKPASLRLWIRAAKP